MSKRTKISTIGAPAFPANESISMEGLVENALSFWRGQLQQVLPDRPDLIVVPEMCDSYGHIPADAVGEYYEVRADRVFDLFAATAKRHNCYITYPAIRLAADGTRFNSVRLLDREGNVAGTYDKNHVVIEETEVGEVYCGTAAPLIDCDFGRVAIAICFDLNFDALRQKYVAARPDLILFPSMFHGGMMQNYWAYSCRAHFVGAISGMHVSSDIISPHGEIIASSTNYHNFVTAAVNLDCRLAHLDGNFAKLQALKNEFGPQVTIHDPGRMGSVLITSETEEVSADQMVEAFEIELLDDYLARSLRHHCGAGLPR